MVTSTSFDRNEAEELTIASVMNKAGKSVITLQEGTQFGHYAAT